jgi:outer membrane receptor for ferrienterochelin and colicins
MGVASGLKGSLTALCMTVALSGLASAEPAPNGSAAAADVLDDVNLEALLNMKVTTTSKRSESISDAPGVIVVVTKDDIQRYGITSMFDLMDLVANVYPMSSYAKRYAIMSVRGIVQDQRNKYNLLLINGRPVREGLQGGVEENMWSSFPVDSIERVEIVRGPGSVLYGTGAFTGVTNIITKKAEGHQVRAATELGTRLNNRATADAGYHTKNAYLYAYGSFLSDRGWDWASIEKYGTPMSAQLDRRDAAAYLHGGLYGLEVNLLYSQIKDRMWMEVPIANALNDTTIDRLVADIGYTHEFTKNLSVKGNFSYGDKEERRPVIKVVPMASLESSASAKDMLGELMVNYSHKDLNVLLGGTVTHANAVQLNYGLDPATLQRAVDANGAYITTHPTPDKTMLSYSGYGQADYTLRMVKGVAGIQVNKVGDLSVDLVPRGSLIVQITRDLGVKGLFAQAYRAPTLFDMYIDATTLVGNPRLKSEKISTVDLQVFLNRATIYTALTGYYSRITNPISIRPTATPGVAQYQNSNDPLKAYGVEWEMKFSPMPGLQSFASLAYAKVNPTTYMPQGIAKLGLSYDLKKVATFSAYEVFYTKPDAIPAVNIPPLPPINSPARDNTHLNPDPTYVSSLNVFASLHLDKLLHMKEGGLDFYVRGVNLLNQKVWIPEFNGRAGHINSFQSMDRQPLTVVAGVALHN